MPTTVPVRSDFELTYLALRDAEGWLVSDEELARLPLAAAGNPHLKEWRQRRQSCRRFLRYLQGKPKPLRILEVGCGNGWFAHRMSEVPGCAVTGLDINRSELDQARRVFGNRAQLRFELGDLRQGSFAEGFDLIVFAASIQYFPSLTEIISAAFAALLPAGEVHLIDSHFYRTADVAAARQRSKEYFSWLGAGAMERFYFHHCWEDLAAFDYEVLYDPASWKYRLQRHRNPFSWIRLKAHRP